MQGWQLYLLGTKVRITEIYFILNYFKRDHGYRDGANLRDSKERFNIGWLSSNKGMIWIQNKSMSWLRGVFQLLLNLESWCLSHSLNFIKKVQWKVWVYGRKRWTWEKKSWEKKHIMLFPRASRPELQNICLFSFEIMLPCLQIPASSKEDEFSENFKRREEIVFKFSFILSAVFYRCQKVQT